MHSDDSSRNSGPYPLPVKPDGTENRREITPEEEEEWIRYEEKRLETLSGDEAEKSREWIRQRKETVAQMRAGTVRICHRIPKRCDGKQ